MATKNYLLCDSPGCESQEAEPYFISVPHRGDIWVDLCREHSKPIKLLYYAIKRDRDYRQNVREQEQLNNRSMKFREEQLRAELARIEAAKP